MRRRGRQPGEQSEDVQAGQAAEEAQQRAEYLMAQRFTLERVEPRSHRRFRPSGPGPSCPATPCERFDQAVEEDDPERGDRTEQRADGGAERRARGGLVAARGPAERAPIPPPSSPPRAAPATKPTTPTITRSDARCGEPQAEPYPLPMNSLRGTGARRRQRRVIPERRPAARTARAQPRRAPPPVPHDLAAGDGAGRPPFHAHALEGV